MISKTEAFLGSFVIVFGIAIAGYLASGTGAWYESVKPSLAPPNYVFSIVWPILYILIACALGLSIIKLKRKPYTAKLIYFLFAINFLSNLLWTFLFFRMHNPLAAFIDIIILDISALLLGNRFYHVYKPGVSLLMPYILWILFATVLNAQILLS